MGAGRAADILGWFVCCRSQRVSHAAVAVGRFMAMHRERTAVMHRLIMNPSFTTTTESEKGERRKSKRREANAGVVNEHRPNDTIQRTGLVGVTSPFHTWPVRRMADELPSN
jgi:hypothetical protein